MARQRPLSDIYARPDLYDIEYEGVSNEDDRFFARLLARVRPRRGLELACGSGRVTFTLAAALPKAEIVGVDSSIEMLRTAAAARDASEPSVRQRVSFVKGRYAGRAGRGDGLRRRRHRLLLGVAFAHARRSPSYLGRLRSVRSVPAASSCSMSACLTSRRSPNRNAHDPSVGRS